MEGFFHWSNNIASILGILVTFPAVLALWELVIGRKRRLKKRLKEASQTIGDRPAILIVDILKQVKNIRANFDLTRKNDNLLNKVSDNFVFEYTWKESRDLKPDDLGGVISEIRQKISEIYKSGVDTIYLVYGGPVVIATILGNELANGPKVILYQHKQGTYENWGPLRHYF